MKILIIEDEIYTALRLKKILLEHDKNFTIVGLIQSVQEAISWLNNNPHPDLIFQDVELSDGNCFEIYETLQVESPFVFTTAYSDHVLKSYTLNSIGYLIKPYDKQDILNQLEKFYRFREILNVEKAAANNSVRNKNRFLIKTGNNYEIIKTSNIQYFYSDKGSTFAVLDNGLTKMLDDTINKISDEINPQDYFRINRQFLVKIDSISSMESWTNSRLILTLNPAIKEDVIVSREKVKDFKKWIGG
jgi:DNA-binding LytR/AlgR family response regulator